MARTVGTILTFRNGPPLFGRSMRPPRGAEPAPLAVAFSLCAPPDGSQLPASLARAGTGPRDAGGRLLGLWHEGCGRAGRCCFGRIHVHSGSSEAPDELYRRNFLRLAAPLVPLLG